MASEQTLNRRRAVLQARGVPERFIENLARRRTGFWGVVLAWIATMVMAMLFVPAMILGDLYGWELALKQWLYGDALKSTLFVIAPNVLSYMVFILWIWGIVQITNIGRTWDILQPVKPSPAFHIVASNLRRKVLWEKPKPLRRLEDFEGCADDTAFLKTLIERHAKRRNRALILTSLVTLLCIPAAIIAGGLIWADSYVAVKADAIEQHSVLGVTRYGLDAVRRVDITCVPDRDGLRYTLVFDDASINILNLWNTSGADMSALGKDFQAIDGRLSARHVPIHRLVPTEAVKACLSQTGPDEFGPDVLYALAFGPDAARLFRASRGVE